MPFLSLNQQRQSTEGKSKHFLSGINKSSAVNSGDKSDIRDVHNKLINNKLTSIKQQQQLLTVSSINYII